MPRHRCSLGCGRFLSSDEGHKCCLHVSMLKMCLGDLKVTVRASPPGQPLQTSYSFRSACPVQLPDDSVGLLHGGPSISFGAPPENQMLITASGDGLSSTEDEDSAGLPPSGVVSDQPWVLGWRCARRPVLSPCGWMTGFSTQGTAHDCIPFFPKVHEEVTKSWMVTCTARSRSSPSSVLTTLNGGAARGYMDIPQVERAVAVHLCPQNAATWRNCPRLPSKAWKL